MSGTQFIHIETYGMASTALSEKQRNSDKSGIIKRTASEVMSEAMREDGAYLHVANPSAPTHVHGCNPSEIVPELEDVMFWNRDPLGRHIRKDAQLLLAGVCSYPHEIGSPEFNKEHFERWIRLSVSFLVEEYGEAYRCTILHTDERFPHLHFYAVPPAIDGRVHMRTIHCGMAARDTVKDVKKVKGTGKARTVLYRNAMRAFQDRYFGSVGSLTALARIGPGVRRLTRDKWRLERDSLDRLMQAHLKIESVTKIAIETKKSVQLLNIEKVKNESILKQNQSLIDSISKKEAELNSREIDIKSRENKALTVFALRESFSELAVGIANLEKQRSSESEKLLKIKAKSASLRECFSELRGRYAKLSSESKELRSSILSDIQTKNSGMFSSSKLSFMTSQYEKFKNGYFSLKTKFSLIELKLDSVSSSYNELRIQFEKVKQQNKALREKLERVEKIRTSELKLISKLKRDFSELFVAFKNGDRSYLKKFRDARNNDKDDLVL
jgi:hypothetical protein